MAQNIENINLEICNDFSDIIGFDIFAYFVLFAYFMDNNYNKVEDFYAGVVNQPDKESFNVLMKLKDQTTEITQNINSYKSNLKEYKYWIVVEKFEEIKLKIGTISILSKYLRTSILPNSYNNSPLTDYTMKPGQTLEIIARDNTPAQDYLNDWVDIAIKNNLIEEDYTPAGGTPLLIEPISRLSSLYVESVIDNLNTENIYGKDIAAKLSFITLPDGTQDLKSLNPQDTIKQSAFILLNLRQGSNPNVQNRGVIKSEVVGQNINILQLPSLLRQIQESFQTDDTFTSITVTDIRRDGTAVLMEFEIKTILDKILPNISLSI